MSKIRCDFGHFNENLCFSEKSLAICGDIRHNKNAAGYNPRRQKHNKRQAAKCP